MKVTYSDFGKHLRLGNFLYSYAFLLGCIKKYGAELVLPDYYLWKYLKYQPFEIDDNAKGEITFHTKHDGFDPTHYDKFFEENKDKSIEVNLSPHYQSQRNWEHCKEFVLENLQFKDEYIEEIRKQYKVHLSRPTIGIGIRLGTDYSQSSDFFQIKHSWYIEALEKYFPNWRNTYNIVIFSDNIELAKQVFERQGYFHFLYAEHNPTHILTYTKEFFHSEKAINHLAFGSLMDNFIIPQSTFSWWQAYLSQNRLGNREGKVICTGKNFAGNYLSIMKNIDYYPKNWIIHPV